MAEIRCILGIVMYSLTIANAFVFDEPSCTETGPKNPVVCFGETLTINCNVKEGNNFNASDLELESNTPVNDTQIVNKTHAVMSIHNYNGSDMTSACCQIKNNDCRSSCQMIQAFDAPVPISNLTCVVYDWSENLNCSWNHGTVYRIKPSVTFEWRIRYITCTWSPCKDYSNKYNYCFFKDTNETKFSMKVFDIKITVKSKCGKEVVNYYTVNTRTIVKPSPVLNLRENILNSTCVKVSWDVTRLEYTKIFEVTINSKWNDTQVQIFNAKDTGKHRHNEAIFCDLIPNTKYSVNVRVKPSQSYWSMPNNSYTRCENCTLCNNTMNSSCECLEKDGYWSDTRQVNPKTYGDVPSASPAISSGSFKWDSNECNNNAGERSVSIYWKPIDPIAENGKLNAYVVTLSKDTPTQEIPGDRYSLTVRIPCDQDTNVTIQGRNPNGTSHVASNIHIMAATRGIFPPTFMVEMSNETESSGERSVYIEWDVQDTSDVTGFTVYHCKKEKGDCAHNSSFTWHHVGRQENSTMMLLKSPEDYLYSVSMEKTGGSSGMLWESCIFTRNAPPKRAPANVDAQASSEDKAILVIWEKLTCQSGKPYIHMYKVQYCNGGNCQELDTKGSSLLLEDLEVGQDYYVRVRGVTITGELGPWSEPVKATPKGLLTGEIVGIVIGCIFVVVVTLFVIVLIIRKCHRRVKDTFTPPPIGDILGQEHLQAHDNKGSFIEEKEEEDKLKEENHYVTLDSGNTPAYMKQLSIESGFVDVGSPDSLRNNEKAFFKDQTLPLSEQEEKENEEKLMLIQRQQQLIQEGYVITTNVSGQVEAQVGFALAEMPVPADFKTVTLDSKQGSVSQKSDHSSNMAYVRASALEDADISLPPREYDDDITESDVDSYLPDTGNSSAYTVDSYVRTHAFSEAVGNSYVPLPRQPQPVESESVETGNQSSSSLGASNQPLGETYEDECRQQDSSVTGKKPMYEEINQDQSNHDVSSETGYMPWEEINEQQSHSNNQYQSYTHIKPVEESNEDQSRNLIPSETGNQQLEESNENQSRNEASPEIGYQAWNKSSKVQPQNQAAVETGYQAWRESNEDQSRNEASLENGYQLWSNSNEVQPQNQVSSETGYQPSRESNEDLTSNYTKSVFVNSSDSSFVDNEDGTPIIATNNSDYVPIQQLEKVTDENKSGDCYESESSLNGTDQVSGDYTPHTLTANSYTDKIDELDSSNTSNNAETSNIKLEASGYIPHDLAMENNLKNIISSSNDHSTYISNMDSEKTDSDSSGFGSLESENKADHNLDNCPKRTSENNQLSEDYGNDLPNKALSNDSLTNGYVPQDFLDSKESFNEVNNNITADAMQNKVPLDFYKENSVLDNINGQLKVKKVTVGYVSHNEGDKLLNYSPNLIDTTNVHVENGYITHEEAVERESET